jgi:hypothetical protein
MEPNRNGIVGAVVGGVLGTAMPGISRFFVWIVAVVGVALLHRFFDKALESRMGAISAIILTLVLSPLFTVLRGSMESMFSFFYFFITVASGYALGTLMTTPDEQDD